MVKLILACQEVPKRVWSLKNRNRLLFVPIQSLPRTCTTSEKKRLILYAKQPLKHHRGFTPKVPLSLRITPIITSYTTLWKFVSWGVVVEDGKYPSVQLSYRSAPRCGCAEQLRAQASALTHVAYSRGTSAQSAGWQCAAHWELCLGTVPWQTPLTTSVHQLVASPPLKHLPPALPIKVKTINLLAQYR